MRQADWASPLREAYRQATSYPTSVPDRRVRALGRAGVAEIVERCCAMARRFAEHLAAYDSVEILNEVVLNQVLVRFLSADGDHDGWTRTIASRLQHDGTCWMGTTTWRGQAAMRISVTNWTTEQDDVDRSLAAIARALA